MTSGNIGDGQQMAKQGKSLRPRFWVEVVFAVITLFLLILTLVQKEWIETIFRVDPDQGNGSFEWLLVLLFALVTVILVAFALTEIARSNRSTAA